MHYAPAQPPNPYRDASLGQFHVLSDPLIFGILDKLDVVSLARIAPRISKWFYLFSRSDDLWKPLCILKFLGNFAFLGTYRETYAGKQIPMPKLEFTDYLNYRYYLSSFPVKDFVADSGHVERKSAKDLTYEQFQEEYDGPSKIVILTDVVTQWPASKDWSLEKLSARFPDVEFKIAQKIKKRFRVTMSKYKQYCIHQHEDEPLYVFDETFGEKAPDLVKDYSVPNFFADDWLSLLGDKRPDFRWVVIGPERSGSPWHVDPTGTSAWNGVISGRKRWAFYPPGHTPPGVYEDHKGRFKSPYPLEWFLYTLPYLPVDQRPIEVVQGPGELIFVPHGWWHCVLNLDEAVAVTQNFINRHNLLDCCEELTDDGRFSEYEDLLKKLEEKYSDMKTYISDIKTKVGDRVAERATRAKFPFIDAVKAVIEKHNLAQENNEAGLPASITPATDSTNLVYFHGELVIKFYTRKGIKESSFQKETDIYAALLTGNQESHVTVRRSTSTPNSFPQVKASGVYLDKDGKEWPYLITNLVDGEPVGAVFMELSPENKLEVADFVARALKEVHALPLTLVPHMPNGWPAFIDYLVSQREEAQIRHEHWQTLPGSLLRQLQTYLPSVAEIRTSLVNISKPPVLVHSDLNDENLLGEWEDDSDNDEADEEEPKPHKDLKPAAAPTPKGKAQTNGHVNGKKASQSQEEESEEEAHWLPLSIIDFGDAKCGDPLWDLVPLHFSCFRADKKVLKRFLHTYGIDARSPTWPKFMMTYVLLHDCDAMSSLYEWRPDLRTVKTFEELATAVWDIKTA